MAVDDSASPAAGGTRSPDLAILPPELSDAVAQLVAASERLAAADPTELDGPQAAVIASALASVRGRLGVTSARLLPVIDADGRWALSGARSFRTWAAAEHRVSVRTAQEEVRLGRSLRDHLPGTAAAAAAGEISLEHAQVLAKLAPTTELRRRVLADAAHECNEAFLVEQARDLSVDDFRVVVRRWAAVADPDADDRGYVEAAEREYLELSRVPDGYHLAGQMTAEHGQCLKAALDAVTPVPAAGDQRGATNRRAQALADLARLTLDHGLAGSGRNVRPRITVAVDYPTFAQLIADAVARGDAHGHQDQLPGFSAHALCGSDPAVTGGPQFEDGTPVPRVVFERLACDSEVQRVVFGPRSHVLDVGRTERLFSGHLRTALIARDKHCRFPGCTAPPQLCEGHHVRHWARDHGPTSVDNGILLCWFHHDLVHRRGIDIAHPPGKSGRGGAEWVFIDRHGRRITDISMPVDLDGVL